MPTTAAPQNLIATTFKILAHPIRIAILDLLRDGEQCVCHLEAHLGKRQAYISQQLALLRSAAIISDRRDGMNSYYRVVRPEIYTLLDAARTINQIPIPSPMPRANACDCPKCISE
ncbi:ArsR/SmtB family transcription factor [Candidatus Oscillochloris fontis]|uniref:ArsR/SmtB family transcription factor n=1 Tax=Candidatus Oscillochloris fontis TaxID=2496868 RepID=UPI00101C0A88|nr:metalloregulator ArsR/SmtB family transcription factor [Candidatus Oscillochloris fontis]